MSLSYKGNGVKMANKYRLKALSLLQESKCCYECGTTLNLHRHHIFYGTANRKLSEKDNLVVYLCYEHHTGAFGVHNGNKALDLKLKKAGQRAYMKYYGKTAEEFRERYGKNYL